MESDPDRARRSPADGPTPGGDPLADRAFDELLRRHAVLGPRHVPVPLDDAGPAVGGPPAPGPHTNGHRNGRVNGSRPGAANGRAPGHGAAPTGRTPVNGHGPGRHRGPHADGGADDHSTGPGGDHGANHRADHGADHSTGRRADHSTGRSRTNGVAPPGPDGAPPSGRRRAAPHGHGPADGPEGGRAPTGRPGPAGRGGPAGAPDRAADGFPGPSRTAAHGHPRTDGGPVRGRPPTAARHTAGDGGPPPGRPPTPRHDVARGPVPGPPPDTPRGGAPGGQADRPRTGASRLPAPQGHPRAGGPPLGPGRSPTEEGARPGDGGPAPRPVTGTHRTNGARPATGAHPTNGARPATGAHPTNGARPTTGAHHARPSTHPTNGARPATGVQPLGTNGARPLAGAPGAAEARGGRPPVEAPRPGGPTGFHRTNGAVPGAPLDGPRPAPPPPGGRPAGRGPTGLTPTSRPGRIPHDVRSPHGTSAGAGPPRPPPPPGPATGSVPRSGPHLPPHAPARPPAPGRPDRPAPTEGPGPRPDDPDESWDDWDDHPDDAWDDDRDAAADPAHRDAVAATPLAPAAVAKAADDTADPDDAATGTPESAPDEPDETDEPAPRRADGRGGRLRSLLGRRTGSGSRTTKVALAALAGLILVASGGGAASAVYLDGAVSQVGALDPQSPTIRQSDLQSGDENVVVLTTDFTPAAQAAPGSLVVAHVPRDSDSVVALSLPTDLEINRPPCARWDPAARTYLDQTVPAEVRTTLISAFEVGGPRCTTKVVQQLTGLAVSRFVAVDRAGVATMATTTGIDPCPPGPPPTTDEARIERDHGQLRAVLSRTLSLTGLLAVPQVLALHDALPSAVLADQVDLGRLLGVAEALDDLDAERITFAPAPVLPTPNVRGHTELRDAEADLVFRAIREDTSLPAPEIRAAAGASLPGPGEVTVDVFNASGRDGLAREVAAQLADLGYGVDEVGNAVDAQESTAITYSPDRAAAAELLQSSVPLASLVPEPSAAGVLELTLGSDFGENVQVQAPGDPGATAVTAAAAGCA